MRGIVTAVIAPKIGPATNSEIIVSSIGFWNKCNSPKTPALKSTTKNVHHAVNATITLSCANGAVTVDTNTAILRDNFCFGVGFDSSDRYGVKDVTPWAKVSRDCIPSSNRASDLLSESSGISKTVAGNNNRNVGARCFA